MADFLKNCKQQFANKEDEPLKVGDMLTMMSNMVISIQTQVDRSLQMQIDPIVQAVKNIPILQNEVRELHEDNETLRAGLQHVTEAINGIMKQNDSYNLVLHGEPEDEKETPDSLCQLAINRALEVGCSVKKTDFEFVRRLGPTKKPTGPRAFLIKVLSWSTKNQIIRMARKKSDQLKKEGADPQKVRPILQFSNHVPFNRLLKYEEVFNFDAEQLEKKRNLLKLPDESPRKRKQARRPKNIK